MVTPSDVVAETSVQKTATASEWATVEKLCAIFPEATTTVMVQRLRYSRVHDAAAEHREVFAVVALAVGPLKLRREFRV